MARSDVAPCVFRMLPSHLQRSARRIATVIQEHDLNRDIDTPR